ncbi:MAG: hypothetical protein GY749_48440 [Desulfobacteraceae bacterium]|nr:hypothetical protein [Desulfobacteraceae bacterium]
MIITLQTKGAKKPDEISIADLVKDGSVVISGLANRFGIQRVLTDRSRDRKFMASFLYYFGILTSEGETVTGKLASGFRIWQSTVFTLNAYRKCFFRRTRRQRRRCPCGRTALRKRGYGTALRFSGTEIFQVFSEPGLCMGNTSITRFTQSAVSAANETAGKVGCMHLLSAI